MALTFVTRKYTCTNCGHKNKAFTVIAKQTDVVSYFPIDSRPTELVEGRLYKEVLVRDEYGLTVERRAVEYPCDECGSINIDAEKLENFSNVMNFYGQSEAGKWFEGFAKHD